MRQVRNQRKHAPPVTSFALCRFILYALPVRLHCMVYWKPSYWRIPYSATRAARGAAWLRDSARERGNPWNLTWIMPAEGSGRTQRHCRKPLSSL